MKNNFVIICSILACHLPALSQNNDQFKIDSLKKVLPSLKDSARVDCLNSLSEAYIGLPNWFSPTPTNTEFDNAEIFALQALEEAKKINYIYGMAKATSLKAELLFEKYNSYPEAEILSREAIDLYKKTANKKGLNKIYWRLATTLHSQGSFEAAIDNYDTAYNLSKKVGDSLFVSYCVIK